MSKIVNASPEQSSATLLPAKAIGTNRSQQKFRLASDGLYATIKLQGKNQEEFEVKVCNSFTLKSRVRATNGTGWARLIEWHDADNQLQTQLINDADLQGDPSKIASALANKGLWIDRRNQKLLADYLVSTDTDMRITAVNKTGWHKLYDTFVFVLPEETIGSSKEESCILTNASLARYEANGTLEQWQSGIGKLSKGQSILTLAICAGISGPLLQLAKMDGCILNLYGRSSIGKSTCLQSAASVWGSGCKDGYTLSWHATRNGLEGSAAAASDTLLVLDEIDQADQNLSGEVVYALANGSGKQRADQYGGKCKNDTWSTIVLSSGESPVETKLTAVSKKKFKAGQHVRCINLAVEQENGLGVFTHIDGFVDAGQFAKSVKSASETYFGTLGPAFIKKLIEVGTTEVEVEIKTFIDKFTQEFIPLGANGQIKRVGERLGLMAFAGEFATKSGLVPWQKGEATNALADALQQWIKKLGCTGAFEDQQAIEQVRCFIEAHGSSRFELKDEEVPVYNCVGFKKTYENADYYCIFSEQWKTVVCEGLDPTHVAKALVKAGFLERGHGGYSKTHNHRGQSVRAYTLNSKILNAIELLASPSFTP